MTALFVVALSLTIASQNTAAVTVAGSNPTLAKMCAQILQAAQRRDFALLMPLLDDPVDLDSHESVPRDEVLRLVQTWPEDFGPEFWRDVRDVVENGLADNDDEYIWRRPGIALQFRRTIDGGLKLGSVFKGRKPRTKIMPVDVASSDPGLAAVRAQILHAVANRDVTLLLPIIGPKIRVDNRDDDLTPPEFVTHQKACTAEECAEFWRELHNAVSLGMVKDPRDEGAWAPYVFVKLPDDVDAVAITGERVALRYEPDAGAPVIEWLSYDVVTMSGSGDWEDRSRPVRIDGYEYGWRHIITPFGKIGWVSEKYARSGLDMRLGFKQVDGHWRLVSITSGD